HLAGRDLVALRDDPRHLRAHLLDGHVERVEHPAGDPLLLAQQAEQDVLGADVVVLQRARLVVGEDDHLAGALGEALEHRYRYSRARASTSRSVAWVRISSSFSGASQRTSSTSSARSSASALAVIR